MRKATLLFILIVLLTLSATATADARRAVDGQQKNAIMRVFGGPPQCARVWISTVRPDGHNWAFAVEVGSRGACADQQPGDAAYLHYTTGRWHVVAADDEVSCRSGGFNGVPLRIQSDLLNCRS